MTILSTGEIFRKYRDISGEQQKDLADKLKTTRNYLSKIERNESPPSKITLEEFFKLYNVTIEEKEAILFYESFRKADAIVRNTLLEYKILFEQEKKKNEENDLGLRVLRAIKKEEIDFMKKQ